MQPESENFGFLKALNAQLFRLAALGEHYFRTDPNTCVVKLRQFAEQMARDVAARVGLLATPDEAFQVVLGALGREGYAPRQALDLFHFLRMRGNAAVHEGEDNAGTALNALKIARQLAIWYARSYGKAKDLAPGPFRPPGPAVDHAEALARRLEGVREEAQEYRQAADAARAEAEEMGAKFRAAEERAQAEARDRDIWQNLAEEADAAAAEVRATLQAMQVQAANAPTKELALLEEAAEAAAERIDLDEADTRELIDQQLRDVGWQADTKTLRHAHGARPAKGQDLAIAEWPTATGPADYALFAGLKLVATVEAKRRNRNVMAALDQAERYSKGIVLDAAGLAAGAPWGEFRAPFVFSTNARPYLRQLRTFSGIWRRDVRRATNPAAPLEAWPTPQGLLERLEVDVAAAEATLEAQGFDFGFPLWGPKIAAIKAVEAAVAAGASTMLIAMATGTGKTKLVIAMLYRLIAAKRFRRICFVVDRSALGDQTEKEFTTTRVVSGKAFADIFGLRSLGNVNPDPETRVHICTIQGLVRRVLFADDPADRPPVDQYDLMVVDECHRGYLLDREMSDAELSFRDQADYVSKYRRVLDHFDAVKIGLTATPALHTVEIFGKPIFTYSYREAVVDGVLIDHEPPVRITTALAKAGIHFRPEEEVEFVHPPTGQLELFKLPDALDFEVDAFNRGVVTEAFNRAVAKELTSHIDLSLPDKTLVFAASDAHADIVVNELRAAFREAHGATEDADIHKVTGSVDQVRKLILSYRNDAQPKIAVTVDLLTTGIDVPKIANLVFLRRVNSRILYEQMLGRATRLCPEIGKETFRIFDAVDLYDRLQDLTEMRPVVADPNISLTQLLDELARVQDAQHQAELRDQIVVRLSRRLKKLSDE
ncbi:MAG TPA: type I restriction-modification system endonuclease, partial [Caulobacteraceae bacterium]